MIKELELEIGKMRLEKEQTRRICRLSVDGEKRGRLSLTFTEATHLQLVLSRGLPKEK